MTQRFRTAQGGQARGRIDRTCPVRFRFDGRSYTGFHGDTLASALLANGVHLVGRSLKYHRPRGILAAGSDEPNALVTVRRDAARVTPNLRATGVELYAGLVAESQNRWPSLHEDLGAAFTLPQPGSAGWDGAYVAVLSDEETGDVGCRIRRADGTVLVEQVGRAPYAEATCSWGTAAEE